MKIAEAPQLPAASTAEAPVTFLMELFTSPRIIRISFNSLLEISYQIARSASRQILISNKFVL